MRQPLPESGRDDLALLLYLHYQPMLIEVRNLVVYMCANLVASVDANWALGVDR